MPDWAGAGGGSGSGPPIPVPVVDGGTGSSTAAGARTNLGLGQVIPQGLGIPTVSNIVAIGHSWIAGTNILGTGVSNPQQDGLLSKLMAMFGVHEDNALNLATGGSRLTGVSGTKTPSFAGYAAILNFVFPNNASVINDATGVFFTDDISANSAAVTVIVHGLNDINPTASGTTGLETAGTLGRTAWKNALRMAFSRSRAGLLYTSNSNAGVVAWDPPITFTGGTDLVFPGSTTGAVVRFFNSGDNTKTVVLTVPINYTGGVVCFNFLSNPTWGSFLSGNGGSITAGALSFIVSNAGDAPTSPFVVKIDNEEILCSNHVGNTVLVTTRGYNGTIAATHNDGAAVVTAPEGIVTWTTNGSNASITGTTLIGGQGYAGVAVPVPKRFVLTAADAGKTITATFSGITGTNAQEQIYFDSVWFESNLPGPTVLLNIPRLAYGGFYPAGDFAFIPSFNADALTVQAEFTDGNTQIADIDTPLFAQGCTLNAGMNNTDVTTTINVTAHNVATFGALPLNRRVMCFGEDMYVTAQTFVSGSTFTLTLTRGVGISGKGTHNNGDELSNAQFMAFDDVHFNTTGTSLLAQTIFDTVQNMPITHYQTALAQGSYAQDSQKVSIGLVDAAWLYPPVNVWGTNATAQNLLQAVPIYIPVNCVIDQVSCSFSAGANTTNVRFGIYIPDWTRGRPGTLLVDFGAFSVVSPGASVQTKTTGVWQVVRPGWYWIACVQQGGVSNTMRTIAAGGLSFPTIQDTAPHANASVQGYQCGATVSGALPTDFTAVSLTPATGATVPYVGIRTRTKALL